jgi:septum formation protein
MTLILASASASRRAMLDAAGVRYEAIPADIDEAGIKDQMRAAGAGPNEIALALAQAKAVAISANHHGRLVLGSDSLVSVDTLFYDKPRSRDDAAAHLRHFSGKKMRLDSAIAFARDGAVVAGQCDTASLATRPLSEAFIAAYLDTEWPAIAGCVGCFRIEGRGVHLFESIDGSHFTVLGMPLLSVLSYLRSAGILTA